ncbi:MAG: LacI family DNA-binding transcriptional regulator [Pseudomonadota bacterium]
MKESDSQRIKSKPTIVDVARLAGVSFKTVSRVINNQSYVGDATRTRVLEAIDALSFVPNMGARTIRGGRHMTIALLFPERKSQYQMEVQDAALGACRNAGYHLIAESLAAEVLQNKDQIAARLSDLRVSGFIVMPPVCDSHELIETLQELSLPYSRLAPGEHLKSGAEVVVDDAAAVRTMVDHLWSLGHRRIGFIVGNASHTSSRIRLGAFLDHFARLAGTVPLDMVRQGDFTSRSGFEAATDLLDLPDPPTAIFASNDEMATGVISCALGRRIAIPEKLSVCGFDDSPVASLIWPPLTTINQPLSEMVHAAVQQLIRPRSNRRVELDLGLIVRQSTGPVP